jgi:arsenate reductase-like glutaredoxin family protein
LQAKKVAFEEREYGKNPFTEIELRDLIGDEPVADILNSRNELYRARNMKQKPPSREAAIKLILKEPNLLRRPVIVKGKKKILGFNESEVMQLL